MAKQWMDYAAKSAPDDLRTRLGIANYYWQINQPADAEAHAQAAREIDETSLEAMLLSGLIAHALKKMDEAESFLNSAHRQSPSNFLATNHLALVLADQNDQSKRRQALELAQVNARQYPRRSDAAATLGWILYLAGRSREAAQSLSTAASSGTVTSETAYYLARLYIEQGKTDDAKRFLEMALNAPAPFVHRPDAKEHHDRLASAAPSIDGDSTGPPSTVPNTVP
jgi:tetratricopeptide (TPR) repeat protein